MNALRRVHRSLTGDGLLLDLQPVLANAQVKNVSGVLGHLDEREFRAYADKVNALLEETVTTGLFALDQEIDLDLVHHFHGAEALFEELRSWTGTTVPSALRRRIARSAPPFDVHEGARLRRFRVLRRAV